MRLPAQPDSLSQQLGDDREAAQADVALGSGGERLAALKAGGVQGEVEALHLAALHRLLGRMVGRTLSGIGAGCPSRSKGGLAGGRAHGDVLAHDLADGEDAEGKEKKEEGGDRPLDEGLARLSPIHHVDPGSNCSMVWTACELMGNAR